MCHGAWAVAKDGIPGSHGYLSSGLYCEIGRAAVFYTVLLNYASRYYLIISGVHDIAGFGLKIREPVSYFDFASSHKYSPIPGALSHTLPPKYFQSALRSNFP